MKFFCLLLLVPAVGWGAGPYSVTKFREDKSDYYQVNDSSGHFYATITKEIAEDLAEALNEAHERRARKYTEDGILLLPPPDYKPLRCRKPSPTKDWINKLDCVESDDPHAVLVPVGKWP